MGWVWDWREVVMQCKLERNYFSGRVFDVSEKDEILTMEDQRKDHSN